MQATPGTGRLRSPRAPSAASAFAVGFAVGLALTLSACHRGPPRPVAPAIEASSARIVAEGDSAAVRRALVRSITRFQDVWRAGWKIGEVARHGALAFHFVQPDLEAGYYSPDVRRYLAIYCNAGWLGLLAQQGPPAANLATEGLPTHPGRMSVAELDAFRARAQSPAQLRTQGMGRVRGDRDRGTICPLWTPAEDDLPLDEADNPDLALIVAMRPRLRRERDSLLDRLGVAAARFPADGWITGQRVRFHLDQQEPAKALAAADLCAAQAAWCQSLRGVALERLARFDEAELAFRGAQRSALGGNDRGESALGGNAGGNALSENALACGDAFVLRIVDDRTRRSLSELDCRARLASLDTLWWLADPLWSDAGNDRFVAHHSRHTWTILRAAVERDERFSWREASGGDAMREVIVRYGWPTHTYWGGRFLDDTISLNREAARRIPDPPYPALEYSPDRMTFIPSWDVFSRPFDAAAAAWTIGRPAESSLDAWWPDEHMRRLPAVRPMPDGQLALLRRDSGMLVALAIDAPAPDQAADADQAAVATMVAGFGPGNTRVIERAPVENGATLRISGHAPWQAFVLSVELESRVPHEPTRRMRAGVRPPQALISSEVALSDPLLLHSRGTDERGALSPVEALALMRGSLDVQRSAPVGLYWETYGLAMSDTVDIAVEIVRDERASLLRRAGAVLGLTDGLRDSVAVRWREPSAERNVTIVPGGTSTIARAVELDLRNVAPGDYLLRVEVRGPGGRTARNERRFRIID